VLVYNKFKNAAVQITHGGAVPADRSAEGGEASAKATYQGGHIMEPSRATIVEKIIPKSLKIQLYKALLDSNAAEHGARMTAMHKATDNADSLLKG
jgi:F-type H+-transporting ATPase subunit gamma